MGHMRKLHDHQPVNHCSSKLGFTVIQEFTALASNDLEGVSFSFSPSLPGPAANMILRLQNSALTLFIR